MNNAGKYKFRLINKRNIELYRIVILILMTIFTFYSLNLIEAFYSFMGFVMISIYLAFCYTTFNLLKINIIELSLNQNNDLFVKYYFLCKLKINTFKMDELYFRVEPRLNNDNEILIYDKYYYRIFKIRGSYGINDLDLDKIAITFKNSHIKEFDSKIFAKETFKNNWRFIKTNYLSKDFFRNFWYV